MRKLIFFVLAVFFAANVFGQYSQNQTMATANTLVSVPANGGLRAALINRTFTDTTAANSHPISTYPFAQIGTTGDGNMWVRNYLATGWVLLGGGTSPSGSFWRIGGNMFPVSAPTRDIGTDATYGGAVGLMTNGVVRAIVPNGGFLLDNDTTSNKIFTWNPSTKEWGYSNWNNGGGGGSSGLTGQQRYALRFPGYSGSNVYTGYFYPVAVPLYDCFYEAWVRVDSSGYLWSDGYGAIHDMLLGFNATDTTAGITGNMYDEYSSTAFDSWDQFPLGTAHHLAVSYDRTNVITYIDGVPSKKTARTGKRQSVAASGSGGGYLGGSDHLNFKGTLFSFRAHEYGLPFYIGGGGIFYPKRDFNASNNNVVFCVDIDNINTNVIEDKSGGFYGQKHDGYRQYSEGGDPIYPQRESGLDSIPQYVVDSIVQSDYQWGQTTAPVGAKIYDFFERQDQVPAYQGATCSLDSTKGGSLGKKKYTVANGGMYGIINGYAWSNAIFSSYVKVTSNSATQDIRVTYANTTSEEDFGILGLLTDDNNKVYAFVDGNGTNIRLYKWAAGVFSNIGYYNQTVSFNELKLTISGGTANVYADGVLRITADVSDVPASNDVGFAINSPFTRIKKFEVY